jgi:hypothetical protein
MPGWALTFSVVAIVAGPLGFGGIASAAAGPRAMPRAVSSPGSGPCR